ncbi:MAG: hypothetical protein ACM358_02980 [Gemmatimonadota bacterium]
MFDGPELPMSILFLSLAAIFVLRGPLGRAIGERIAGGHTGDVREVQDLKGDVEELRQQLSEVQERLDFAERLLARQEDRAPALPKVERGQ